MALNIPEMPQHLVLAIDRHQHLVEVAQRRRLARLAHGVEVQRGSQWQGWRVQVGRWLIRTGQWLAPEAGRPAMRANRRAKTVWG